MAVDGTIDSDYRLYDSARRLRRLTTADYATECNNNQEERWPSGLRRRS
jgi:hypothetical protein